MTVKYLVILFSNSSCSLLIMVMLILKLSTKQSRLTDLLYRKYSIYNVLFLVYRPSKATIFMQTRWETSFCENDSKQSLM